MSVAVIIPNKNYGQYLGECLWSVLRQTVPAEQVIVVDGCSADSSLDVFKRWANLATHEPKSSWHFISAPPKGIPAARNYGISSVPDADFILPLDADDWIESSYIERCLPLFQFDRVGIVAPSLAYYPGGTVQHPQEPINVETLAKENRLFTCSMFRREAWEAVGGYDETPCYEDWLLWLSIVRKGWDVAVLKEPLFHYRIHEGSSSRSMKPGMHELYSRYVQEKGRHVSPISTRRDSIA